MYLSLPLLSYSILYVVIGFLSTSLSHLASLSLTLFLSLSPPPFPSFFFLPTLFLSFLEIHVMAASEARLALDIQYMTFKPFVSGEFFIFKPSPLTHEPENTAAVPVFS